MSCRAFGARDPQEGAQTWYSRETPTLTPAPRTSRVRAVDGERSSVKPAGEDDAARANRKVAACVGQVVSGRYRIEEVLAFGGMGAVYRAEHVHMRKRVALKLLHPSTENLPELVARFERESIVGSHVSHPNVCAATDFGTIEDGSALSRARIRRGQDAPRGLEGRPPPARARSSTGTASSTAPSSRRPPASSGPS